MKSMGAGSVTSMLVIVWLLSSATPVLALHNISVYDDVDFDDSSAYAYVAAVDDFDDYECDHPQYQTYAGIEGPTGSNGGWLGGDYSWTSVSLGEGNFDVWGEYQVYCGCAGVLGDGSSLEFDVSYRITYYRDGVKIGLHCHWGEPYCVTGDATCQGGYVQQLEFVNLTCDNYLEALYLVTRVNGGPWQCRGAVGLDNQPAGTCT